MDNDINQTNPHWWADALCTMCNTVCNTLDTIETNGGRPFHFLAFVLAFIAKQQDNPYRVLKDLYEEARAMVPDMITQADLGPRIQ